MAGLRALGARSAPSAGPQEMMASNNFGRTIRGGKAVRRPSRRIAGSLPMVLHRIP